MNRMVFALPLAMLAAFAPSPLEAAEEVTIRYETYVLPNGLRVILHEDHRLPTVAVNLWYYVGAKDEPPGRSGFAHLFEHLMFMGTERVPTGAFDMVMEAGGGSNNATTSPDRTNYYESGPRSLLPTLLWLEADRMEGLGPAMTQKKLDLQREVVRNERRQSYEIAPYGRGELAIFEAMFPRGHPYRLSVIGSHEEIEAASVADVKGFFARFYVPNNACLVVAGDFDPATTKPLIERLFGSLPRGEDPIRNIVPPVELPAERFLTLEDPQVELARTSLVWHSPASYEPGDAEMDLVAAVLAQGKTGRLYKRLVYRDRTAQEVSALQGSMALGSLLQVDLTATPGVSLEEVEKAADEEIARLLAEGPTAEELRRVVNGIEAASISALQSITSLADRLNAYQFWFGTPDGLEKDLDRYRRATPESVRDWARKVLRTDRRLRRRVVPPTKPAEGSRDQRPPDAARGAFTLPTPEVFTLKNGLPVWLLHRPGLPLVAVRLQTHAGATLDPAGRGGTASLAADMLDEGAGRWDALGFSQAMEDLGARFGTGADRDGAAVTLEILKRNLAPALELFGAAATSPRFTPSDWDRVKAQTLAWLQQQDAEPTYAARRLGLAAWFGESHPYGIPVEGRPETVARVEVADVKAFHAARYGPDRATLLVAGDVTRAEVEPLLEKALGAWKPVGAAAPPPSVGAAAGQGLPRLRVLIADRPGAAQTVIRFVLPGLPYASAERIPLTALNTVFGGSFTSRLMSNLREDKGYTYGVSSAFAFLRQAGQFVASSSVLTDVTGAAVKEFLAEFRRIQAGDVTPEEVVKAQASMRQDAVDGVSTLAGMLATFAPAVVHGRPPSAPAEDLARLEKGFTAADLNALAAERLALRQGVLVLVGDRAAIEPQLKDLGLAEPEIVKE
jgi:predicted Zn-dependent peptidase